ncbi:MAG: hypothetical protein ACM3JB_24895 [Acidobacteriaceae bacterium]
MERIYLVTPDMRGLTWPRLIRLASMRSGLYLLAAILFSALSNGNWTGSIGAALIGSVIDFALTLSVRFYAPKRLRVTDGSIEEIDGPVVRKNEVLALNEHNDTEPQGIEVVGRRSPSWLPKYRIFVPVSVDGFNELRQLLYAWERADGNS